MINIDPKNRLSQVIQKMKIHGISKLLMHNRDEYQSEYPYKKRLQWLCNFSGSNATIILTLENKHIFFTDGRYIEQAQRELDNKIYEIYDFKTLSPHDWLKKNYSTKEVLGYEEKLFTLEQIEEYQDFHLKNIQEIIIDNFYKFPDLIQDIVNLPLCYCGIDTDQKIDLIISKMNDNEEAYLITDTESLSWITNTRNKNFHYSPTIFGKAILCKDKRLYVYFEKANNFIKITNKNIQLLSYNDFFSFLEKIDNLVIDKATISMNMFSKMTHKNLIIKNYDNCLILKSQKNSQELQGAMKAHERDGIAVINFLHWVHFSLENNDEITELSAEEKLLFFRKQQLHFQRESFSTISAFAENAAIIHYKATEKTNKKIKDNGLYLIDSGGQYLDGTTDVTRTIAIGEPTFEQKNNFTRVLKGHIALALCIFPDNSSGQHLDILARQYLWKEGLDYAHATGHGVGSFLSVHEGPQAISRKNQVALKHGMILSNEPGYYKNGEYGIRIENLMYIQKMSNGFLQFIQLTCIPIDKRLINTEILTTEEIYYINNYHKHIYKKLSDNLSHQVRSWLQTQCTNLTKL